MRRNIIIKICAILLVIAIIIIISIIVLLKNVNKKYVANTESTELTIKTDIMKLQSSKVLLTVEDIIMNNAENSDKVYIEDAYYKDSDTTKETTLYLYVTIWKNEFSLKEKNYIIINLNEQTMQYNIKTEKTNITKQEYNNIIETLKKEQNNKSLQIEYNKNNIFQYKNVTNEDIIQRYIEYFITLELYSPEEAYELLEENYKQKRYGDINEFKKYISENRSYLEMYTIEKYAVNYKDNFTEYIAIDIYDNYYIIQEKELLNFNIQLDNYTIENQEYINKYNSLTNEQKSSIAVSKVIKMINTSDLKNLYDMIDETYRKENFVNIEEFEKYIKNKFFKYNIIENCNSISNVGRYICDLTLKSGNTSSAEELKTSIIVKLEENTKFKIAFVIE